MDSQPSSPSLVDDAARSIVQEGVPSGLNISLHPLPILNVTEHLTRTRLQLASNNVQVFGALLGLQTGRDIEIVNSFEFIISDDGHQVDHGLFRTRQEQFKQVFPTLDFMGWYSIGPYPTTFSLSIHSQLLVYSESPLLLMLSPLPPNQISELPVAVFESVTEIVGSEAKQAFVRCTFKVETGEAERIAVDGVAKPPGSSSIGSDSALVANLTTQRNATKMLHDRIHVIIEYLEAVEFGKVPRDHHILRQINSLVGSLPVADSPALKREYFKEYSDVMLTSYLAAQTRALNDTNELFDRFMYMAATTSRDAIGGMGSASMGGGGGTRRYGSRNLH